MASQNHKNVGTIQQEESSRSEQFKKAAKDWFLRQNYAAKLTALMLYEMSDPDLGNADLAGEVLEQYKKYILHNTGGRTAKNKNGKNGDEIKIAFLCFMARS